MIRDGSAGLDGKLMYTIRNIGLSVFLEAQNLIDERECSTSRSILFTERSYSYKRYFVGAS